MRSRPAIPAETIETLDEEVVKDVPKKT